MNPPPDYRQLLQNALVEIRALRSELNARERASAEPIALIGMACRFPGRADTPEAFWELLERGGDAIGDIPPERWQAEAYYDPRPDQPGKMYVRQGGFIEGIEQFDPQFFGMAPREAIHLDPQQRLLLELAWEALERAGIAADRLQESQTGVFVGSFWDDYSAQRLYAEDPARIDGYRVLSNLRGLAAGRLAYVLGLHGPAMQLDTACSSSLLAVHLACQSLRRGECDLALAGGVSLNLAPYQMLGLCAMQALAHDGRSKPFAAAADGFGSGEGGGLVVLKRLTDAVAAGDSIIALIRGSAVNHDGRSNGLTVPNGQAQAALLRQALDQAGVGAGQIQYVEAHGTGTVLGDPIEVLALAEVLCRDRATPLALGSVKSNIGHLQAAAGVASLIKTALALQHGIIPPSLHFTEPNPHIPWAELPLTVPTAPLPWPGESRRAGVSAFGMSGTNVHLILEQAPPDPGAAPPDPAERPCRILALSAKTAAALAALKGRYADFLAANPELPLADICFTAATGRSHFRHRLALVAATTAELREGLAAGEAFDPAPAPKPPAVAFLFTGQGAQYVGMGRELYETQPVFRRVLQQCDAILRPLLDIPLLEILYPASAAGAEFIDSTTYTQPALFALEYALAETWKSWGIQPAVVLGHSVGEYVAACVAGVYSLEEGLGLIAARGRLMGALPEGGTMVALMAGEARVRAALGPPPAEVAIAVLNGPEHTVISGRRGAVEAVVEKLSREGVKATPLKVSHAFHSPLMAPMLAEFAEQTRRIEYHAPRLPLISNVSGRRAGPEIAAPDYWVDHVRATVRFAEGIASLHREGAGVFLEIGPKPVLLGMTEACLDAAVETRPALLPSLRFGRSDWRQLSESLAALYRQGVEVDWAGFERGHARRKRILPTYPFQRQRCWSEAPCPVPARPRFGLPPDYLPPMETLRGIMQEELEKRLPEFSLERYGAAMKELETRSVGYVVTAFRAGGLSFEPGSYWRREGIAERIGVIAPHRRLLERLLSMLVEAGLIEADAEGWTVRRAPDERAPSPFPEAYRAVANAQWTLVERCGPHLLELLRGLQAPLELLFPGGDASTASQLYSEPPPAQLMNHLVRWAVRNAIAELPPGRGLRILELGAGTGSTTEGLLPLLPAGRTEYYFTDLGALFLSKAQARFAAYDHIRYHPLDIERSPADQGFVPHQCDIVIAANILHATRDLGVTLSHVRQLLAPGGLLVLLELSICQRWLDITFALIDGWWRFADQRSGQPLLGTGSWRERLLAGGFRSVACFPEDPAAVQLDQAVILAQAPPLDGAAEPRTEAGELISSSSASRADESSRSGMAYLPDLRGFHELTEAQRDSELEGYLRSRIAATLGLEAQRIDLQQALPALGLDSLMAVELRNRIQRDLEINVPLAGFLEAIPISELLQRMRRKLAETAGAPVPEVALQPAPRHCELPLSFAQALMWRRCRSAGEQINFNVVNGWQLDGELDLSIFERCLDELQRRHEILRTALPQQDGVPVQVVAPPGRVDPGWADLSGWPAAAQTEAIAHAFAAEIEQPFDPDTGPLWRVRLLRLNPRSHVFLVCMHHLIMDLWSCRILIGDLAELYAAFSEGRPSSLPPLGLQYADFAYWQRQFYTPERLAERHADWQRLMTPPLPVLELPTDRPRPVEPARYFHADSSETIQLSAELTRRLKTLSQAQGVTLSIAVLAAYVGWLRRYSGGDDILLGMPLSKRDHPLLEPLIGLFSGLALLRVDVSGRPSFLELAARLHRQVLEAVGRQDLSFEQVCQALHRDFDARRAFPARVLFNFLPMPDRAIELPGLTIRPRNLERTERGGLRSDIALLLGEERDESGESRLQGRWYYRKELFEPETIKGMIEDFRGVVETLLADPSRCIEDS